MFANNKIKIDSKCKTLIDHCKYGVWNEQRTSYQRTASMGHFDAIDALVYLVRNLIRDSNPIDVPVFDHFNTVYHGEREETTKIKGSLGKIFSRRR